jgi:hypothetical protein
MRDYKSIDVAEVIVSSNNYLPMSVASDMVSQDYVIVTPWWA